VRRAPLLGLGLVLLAAGCGTQSGLHLENGGRTVAVAGGPKPPAPGTQPTKQPRRITARVALGGVPTLAWDGSSMWAAVWANGPGVLGSLVSVDPVTGRARRPLPLPPSARPYLLAASADGLFVATDRRVLRIDPVGGRVIASLALASRPKTILQARGSLWVTLAGGPLLQLDPVDLRITKSFPGMSAPDSVTIVPGAIYVTDDRDRALVRLDPSSGRLASTVSIGAAGAARPSIVTVYGDSIWVYEGSSVVRLARRGRRLLDRISLPDGRGAMAAGTGGVWVSGGFGVARIDPTSGELGRPIALSAGGAALATTGDAVWVADGHGTLLRISP
jgi:streptogramin lyase